MLVGKPLVKELGLQEQPALGSAELQGINGPRFRPTTFVTMEFKLPWLELGWVTVRAYVIRGNVGFNLGNRAIKRFGLLTKLQELEQIQQEWVVLRRRRQKSAARSVNPVISKRSKAQKERDARKHQERSPLAAGIAAIREQSQRTTAYHPSTSQYGQDMYASSIGSSSISTTAASFFVDPASSSHAPTRSTSAATSFSMESSEQKRTA